MHAVGHSVPKIAFYVTTQTPLSLINRTVKSSAAYLRPKTLFPSFQKPIEIPISGTPQTASAITMSQATCMHSHLRCEASGSKQLNGIAIAAKDEVYKPKLLPKKVVVVGKMTRYQFERHRFEGCSEEEFKSLMSSRGSDYDALVSRHHQHLKTMASITEVLKSRGIDYQLCTRGKGCNLDLINWADAIITAGGDGTFLSAASKIRDQSKPLIGINTHPTRSEGHLCLPPKYTSDLGKALDKLAEGQFRWLWRQRIRITMTGSHVNFRPIRNGDVLQSRMSNTALSDLDAPDYIEPQETPAKATVSGIHSDVLPVLALNEVFIGESLAAVPSYYDLKVDESDPEEQKSSGLCVCTGTGSTAWSYNICRLHQDSVRRVLEIAARAAASEELVNGIKGRSISGGTIKLEDEFVENVTNTYSQSYIFEPDLDSMLYSVRDPMQNRVFTCEKCNGFAKQLVVRSRCWDAALCIDGEISFPFNDGAVATLEMRSEDALRTVVLFEDEDENDNPIKNEPGPSKHAIADKHIQG